MKRKTFVSLYVGGGFGWFEQVTGPCVVGLQQVKISWKNLQKQIPS